MADRNAGLQLAKFVRMASMVKWSNSDRKCLIARAWLAGGAKSGAKKAIFFVWLPYAWDRWVGVKIWS